VVWVRGEKDTGACVLNVAADVVLEALSIEVVAVD
jgi:hypothetical protein